MQIFLLHVIFYMSVLGVVAEIVEDEELKKEKPDTMSITEGMRTF
jgi:hypothetical protein